MSYARPLIAASVMACVAIASSGTGCGGASSSGFPDPAAGGDGGGNGDGGGFNFTDDAHKCAGLECKKVVCADGSKTKISGTVYDPAGKNPLYNIIVYVPNAPLPPQKDGVSCETCGSIAANPVVSALTDAKGEFVLEDVPVDQGLPIVIQVGKWRRTFTLDVTQCTDNKMPDKTLTLPKNGSEGDMPQIAVTAGGCDSLECLLRGIGIDDSEFVAGAGGTGHVHMYKGSGGIGMSGTPDASGMWDDLSKLSAYDMTVLSCECNEHNENKGTKQAMHDYIEAGGKVFASHYHYTWFKNSPQADFKTVAKWGGSGYGTSYDVDQTFPKGMAFADWLVNVGASSTKGKITLNDVTSSISTVPNPPSQSWILSPSPSNTVKYFSFNAPMAAPVANQCGRVVYGDLHVSAQGGIPFPGTPSNGCKAKGSDLTPQEKALEFLFFDLSSCVQDDKVPPSLPH